MVEDINLDRVGGTPTSAHEKGKDQLVQLKQQCGLADIWRQKSQNVRKYTWSSPNSLIHSRIDRIYLSDTLQPSFLSQTHLLNSFSDHKTLCLTLQLKSNIRRGEGYWKLNVSLLKDAEYRKLIEDFLTEWINCLPNHPCIQTWWIECKNWVKHRARAQILLERYLYRTSKCSPIYRLTFILLAPLGPRSSAPIDLFASALSVEWNCSSGTQSFLFIFNMPS